MIRCDQQKVFLKNGTSIHAPYQVYAKHLKDEDRTPQAILHQIILHGKEEYVRDDDAIHINDIEGF
jgi:hypothetical protein